MNPITCSASRSIAQPDASWKTILECAATEVFQIMLGSQLEPWPNADERPSGAMTGMVGLAGALCGVMSVRCSSDAANQIATRMLGGDSAVSAPMITDAMGEICNMVAGNFKAKITGLTDHCLLSVPTVVRGEDYELQPVAASQIIEVVLSFDGSPIWISLAIHS